MFVRRQRPRARLLLHSLLALHVGAAAGGCKGSNIVRINTQTDTFVQKGQSQLSDSFTQRPGTIDILFAVADNPYMCAKQQKLSAAFAQFVGALSGSQGQSDAGLDFHIGVVTSDLSGASPGSLLTDSAGDPFLTAASPNLVSSFGQIVAKVGSNGTTNAQPLLAAATALTGPRLTGPNQGFLRDQASLAVIVVDDEDDYSIQPSPQYQASLDGQTSTASDPEIAYFDRIFKSLKGPGQDGLISVSAIVGADPSVTSGPPVPLQCTAASGSFPSCRYPNGDADPAPRTLQVVIDTGGLGQSICQTDFSGILANLGSLLGGLSRQFSLKNTNGGSGQTFESSSLQVSVTPPGGSATPVAANPTNGWSFDATSQTLQFNGTAVPVPGAKITVTFAELQDSFKLTLPPVVSSLAVTVALAGGQPQPVVDASSDPVNGWTYDAANQAIVFPAANLPPLNATITVSYATE